MQDDISLWFWLALPYDYWRWSSFHVNVDHFHFVFGKMSIRFFYPFLNQFGFLMLSCMNCLYMLYSNLLSVILFANIFSHSVGCLFILSMVSFAMQKHLSLISFHLFIFVFIFFRDRVKYILLQFMSECSYAFLFCPWLKQI